MFRSYSQAQINEAERKYWRGAKARGKTRFILREAILGILIWFGLPVIEAFVNSGHLFSMQFFVIWLIMLPICLLYGYLLGSWRWKDFEKKYPE